MKTQLLIPAAGMGVRLGCKGPKALVELAGKPMLVRTLERLAPLGFVDRAVIMTPPEWRGVFSEALLRAFPGMALTVAEGGAQRQDSVERGLALLEPDTEIVVVHDAARPFVPLDSVMASIDAALACGAATVAIPTTDTVLQGDEDGFLVDTPDRRFLWMCQTPQTFRVPVIRTAHAQARRDGYIGTDDATLVRRTGAPVKLVMGSPANIKITTPSDLAWADQFIRKRI